MSGSIEPTRSVDFLVQIPNADGDEIESAIPIQVEVRITASGEEILTPESLDKIEETVDRHWGLMTPLEIRRLRERLNLTQKEMSELIQAGEKSYTRWENGKSRVSRLVNTILCALRDGVLPVSYLRKLKTSGKAWRDKDIEYAQLNRMNAHEFYWPEISVLPSSHNIIIFTPFNTAQPDERNPETIVEYATCA